MIKNGDKFGRFTVINFSHKDSKYRKFYEVICECGNKKIINGSLMKSGNTKSCGCYGKQIRKSKRISDNHSEITAIILGYKRHAKDRNLEWNLSRDFVENLIKQQCFYCDSPPTNIKKTKNSIGNGLKYSGIDRINSNYNYDENNVVPCCKICNVAKRDMSIVDFYNWASNIGTKALNNKLFGLEQYE